MRQQPHVLSPLRRTPRSSQTGPWTAEVHRSVEPLADAWDELADRIGAPPFLRPGWFAAWWGAFGRGSLEILALSRDGNTAAVLPMERRRGALRSLSNWHTPGFAPIAERDAEPALAAQLVGARARRITLAFVDPRSRFVAACGEAAGRTGRRAIVRVIERSPFLPLDGTWDEFERERFSRKQRAELRRRRRQLIGQGPLAVDLTADGDRLDGRLAEGLAVEARSWKGSAGTAIASRPETRRFYAQVARWAAARGELRLAFLRVGGEAVAFDLALESGGAHYLLKTGYDPAYARFAPGAMLRFDMVARAFARGLDAYEFLGQDDPWKREWTDRCHDRATLQLFAPGPAGRLDWATWTHVAPVARRLAAIARR